MNRESLRVAIVSPLFHPELGGLGRQAFHLTNALARSGVGFLVVSRRFSGLPSASVEEGIREVEVTAGRQDVRFLESRSLINLSISVRFALGAFRELGRRRGEFDLVHFHGASLPFLLLVGPLIRWGKPVLAKVAAVGIGSEMGSLKGRYLGLGSLLARQGRRAAGFVATSAEIETGLIRDGVPGDRIHRIPNFVDPVRFRPPTIGEREAFRTELGAGSTAPVLVVVSGRLTARKGHTDLLVAWARRSASTRDAQLLVVGDGPEAGRLRRLAAELGIRSSVRFLGFVPEPERVLRAADLFVLPSLHEGMSNALLEALACGVPAVASRVSGVPDLEAEGAMLDVVEPGRPAELAGALSGWIENETGRLASGRRAADVIARRFTLAGRVAAYGALYERLRSDSRLVDRR